MTTRDVLRLAQEALAIRRDIISATAQHRRDLAERHSESRANTARHVLSIAESATRIRQLQPAPPENPLERIKQSEQAMLAKLRAKAQVQTEKQRQSHSSAEQAALSRAAFIEKVQRDVPVELQQDAIDNFDRMLFESQEDDS